VCFGGCSGESLFVLPSRTLFFAQNFAFGTNAALQRTGDGSRLALKVDRLAREIKRVLKIRRKRPARTS
jgi:hypothetical protein